jgi:hypothetical protein
MLDQPQRREAEVPIDFVDFTIGDVFVIGYGTTVPRNIATDFGPVFRNSRILQHETELGEQIR